jgi:hypothetical protein
MIAVATLAIGCSSAPKPAASSILPNPTVAYSCENGPRLQVRLDGPSASVIVDGEGPFTLPQLSSSGDLTVFSDGRRVLQIRAGRVSWAIGRATPVLCLSS